MAAPERDLVRHDAPTPGSARDPGRPPLPHLAPRAEAGGARIPQRVPAELGVCGLGMQERQPPVADRSRGQGEAALRLACKQPEPLPGRGLDQGAVLGMHLRVLVAEPLRHGLWEPVLLDHSHARRRVALPTQPPHRDRLTGCETAGQPTAATDLGALPVEAAGAVAAAAAWEAEGGGNGWPSCPHTVCGGGTAPASSYRAAASMAHTLESRPPWPTPSTVRSAPSRGRRRRRGRACRFGWGRCWR
jgi:hypothetical protein